MILILGFTPWRSHRDSQLISIVSSSFHLVKASAQLVTFKNKKEKKDMVGVVEKLKNFVAKKLQLLRAICHLFPLLLSSVIFNVGTMALAISVLGWHSVWFLIGSLVLHLVLFFSLPFKLDLKMMKTFNLENHLPKEDADHPSKPFLSGLFFSSSNMFIFSCSSGAAKVNHFPYLPSIPIYFKISQNISKYLKYLKGSPDHLPPLPSTSPLPPQHLRPPSRPPLQRLQCRPPQRRLDGRCA